MCQCPTSGFLHFYGTPPETLCLCGFPDPFLQVIHRIFWKLAFFPHFLGSSVFSYSQIHFQVCISSAILPGYRSSVYSRYHKSGSPILQKIDSDFPFVNRMMKIIARISDTLLNSFSVLPLDNTLSSDYIICRLHRHVNFNMKEFLNKIIINYNFSLLL